MIYDTDTRIYADDLPAQAGANHADIKLSPPCEGGEGVVKNMGIKMSNNRCSIFNIKYLLLFFLLSFFLISSADALTVSPPLIEVEAEPGEELIQPLKVFNETNQNLEIYPSLENFAPKRGGGLPAYLGDTDPLGAARWIKLPISNFKLKPGELKEILLTIKVPGLAEPGGHYVALFWSDQPPQKKGIVTGSRVASLFLFKIKGKIKEQAQIVSFQKKEANQWPAEFILWFRNDSNVHLKPGGYLEIYNWRSQKIKEVEINPRGQAVLPQSLRHFSLIWPETKPFLGLYQARAVLVYGANQQEIISPKIEFWVWPSISFRQIFGWGMIILLIWAVVKIARRKFRAR